MKMKKLSLIIGIIVVTIIHIYQSKMIIKFILKNRCFFKYLDASIFYL